MESSFQVSWIAKILAWLTSNVLKHMCSCERLRYCIAKLFSHELWLLFSNHNVELKTGYHRVSILRVLAMEVMETPKGWGDRQFKVAIIYYGMIIKISKSFYNNYQDRLHATIILETISGSIFKATLHVNRVGQPFIKTNTTATMNPFFLKISTIF